MAERPIIDQLDDAVTAIIERRLSDLTSFDAQVSELADVAGDLVGLPRETFKAELKAKLIRSDEMSSPAKQTEAPRARTVSLHICVSDGKAAIDFYKAAFGAKELMVLAEPSGKIGHAELQIGDSIVSLSDEYPDYDSRSPQTIGGSSIRIHLDVTDVDAFAQIAINAGAKLVRPIEDQFYGDRAGQLLDPFGYTWHVSTHLKDVPLEDLQREVVRFADEEARKSQAKPGKNLRPGRGRWRYSWPVGG